MQLPFAFVPHEAEGQASIPQCLPIAGCGLFRKGHNVRWHLEEPWEEFSYESAVPKTLWAAQEKRALVLKVIAHHYLDYTQQTRAEKVSAQKQSVLNY